MSCCQILSRRYYQTAEIHQRLARLQVVCLLWMKMDFVISTITFVVAISTLSNLLSEELALHQDSNCCYFQLVILKFLKFLKVVVNSSLNQTQQHRVHPIINTLSSLC